METVPVTLVVTIGIPVTIKVKKTGMNIPGTDNVKGTGTGNVIDSKFLTVLRDMTDRFR